MPSSKKTPKKRVEAGDKESSTEAISNAAQVGESSIALMQQMFQHMQHQAEADREQQREDRERQAQREEEMQHQMQELMERMRVNEERRENRSELVLTEALEKLQASRETATPITHTEVAQDPKSWMHQFLDQLNQHEWPISELGRKVISVMQMF